MNPEQIVQYAKALANGFARRHNCTYLTDELESEAIYTAALCLQNNKDDETFKGYIKISIRGRLLNQQRSFYKSVEMEWEPEVKEQEPFELDTNLSHLAKTIATYLIEQPPELIERVPQEREGNLNTYNLKSALRKMLREQGYGTIGIRKAFRELEAIYG